jgi:hypothetical protein
MKNFTPTEERAEIERLARLISKSLHLVDPETLIFSGKPPRLTDGPYVADSTQFMPLWARYSGAAKVVFDDARRQEELSADQSDAAGI